MNNGLGKKIVWIIMVILTVVAGWLVYQNYLKPRYQLADLLPTDYQISLEYKQDHFALPKLQQEKILNNPVLKKIHDILWDRFTQELKKFNDQANNDFKVVIANPFAVAESISLHKGCHNAVYMERDYNCSNFLQSKDRIHRVGLSEGQVTNYYYILSKDSVDDVINQQLNIKVERMERIIDEEIPLFSRIDDSDETDLIKALLDDYAKRTQ